MSNIVNGVEDIAAIVPIGGVSGGEPDFMSLDDRMLQAYAKSAVELGGERQGVLHSIETGSAGLSDPGALFAMQQRISNYNLEVSLISVLARKGVSACETLLRA
jgi:hypothetical protein